MISQTAEYALRAALYLAARQSRDPASAREIAEVTQVPVGYLQKILRMMARAGIVSARRGVGGGFTLAKVPSAISVLDVLVASENEIQRIERCPLGIKGHTRLCTMHRLLDTELARTEQVFASTSLGDLLDGEGGVRPMFEPEQCNPIRVELGVRVHDEKSGQ